MQHPWLGSITLSAVLWGSLCGCEVSQKLGDEPGSGSEAGGSSAEAGTNAISGAGPTASGSTASNGGASSIGGAVTGSSDAQSSSIGGQTTSGQGGGGTIVIAAGGSSQGPDYGESLVTHLTVDPVAAGDSLQMVYRVTWNNGEQQEYVFATGTGSNVLTNSCGGGGYRSYYVFGTQPDTVGWLSISLTHYQGATATLRDPANNELTLEGSMELLEGPPTGCCRSASANFRFHGKDDASIVVEGHFTALLQQLVTLC